jgi:hypothetical protein
MEPRQYEHDWAKGCDCGMMNDMAALEIFTCIVALGGTVKLATSEYSRFRTSRQLSQALRMALDAGLRP